MRDNSCTFDVNDYWPQIYIDPNELLAAATLSGPRWEALLFRCEGRIIFYRSLTRNPRVAIIDVHSSKF